MQKKNYKSNIVVRLAFTLIFVFLFVSVINMQIELKNLKDRKEQAEETLKDIEDNITEINYKLNAPRTAEYYARVAMERLGYRNPNEIIFYNDVAD